MRAGDEVLHAGDLSKSTGFLREPLRAILLPLPEPDKDISKPVEGELTIARGEFEKRLWLSPFLYVFQFIG